MLIEISCEDLSGCTGYKIYKKVTGKAVLKSSGLYRRNFYEDDIYHLLDKKQYKKFEEGEGLFDVPYYKLFVVSDNIDYYRPQDIEKITRFRKITNIWSV